MDDMNQEELIEAVVNAAFISFINRVPDRLNSEPQLLKKFNAINMNESREIFYKMIQNNKIKIGYIMEGENIEILTFLWLPEIQHNVYRCLDLGRDYEFDEFTKAVFETTKKFVYHQHN